MIYIGARKQVRLARTRAIENPGPRVQSIKGLPQKSWLEDLCMEALYMEIVRPALFPSEFGSAAQIVVQDSLSQGSYVEFRYHGFRGSENPPGPEWKSPGVSIWSVARGFPT